MEKQTRASVRWIYGYSRDSLWQIALLAVFGGVIAGSFVLLALASSRLLDIVTGSREGDAIASIASIAGLIFLQAALNVVNSNLCIRAVTKIEMRIRRGIFASLLKKRYLTVSKMHSGEILNRLTSDIEIVASGIVGLLPQAVSLLTKIVAGLAVLFLFDARFTAVVLGVGLLVCFISRFYSRHFKYLHKEVQRTNGAVRSFVQECMENLIVIKSFANGEAVCRKLEGFQKDNYAIRVKRNAISNAANTLFYVFFTAGYYAALIWGAIQIAEGRITFGTLTAFLQIIQQIKAPFRNMSGLIPQYYSVLASGERLMELEEMETEQDQGSVADTASFYEGMTAVAADDITFAYEDETILEHASLRIEKGALTGIAGESGIGKSTMMKLLLYLEPCISGEVYFEMKDGRRAIDAGTRHVFSYVPQGNMIMSGSIRENITFCNEKASEEEIRRAAETACIWEYIETLPDGLDTVLAERGEGLSEGQIQRIAIARAILNDAPILLLDECTSSLDQETEWKVLQNLKAMKTKTILCISHTPAGIACCDKVYRIENKKFVEE